MLVVAFNQVLGSSIWGSAFNLHNVQAGAESVTSHIVVEQVVQGSVSSVLPFLVDFGDDDGVSEAGFVEFSGVVSSVIVDFGGEVLS